MKLLGLLSALPMLAGAATYYVDRPVPVPQAAPCFYQFSPTVVINLNAVVRVEYGDTDSENDVTVVHFYVGYRKLKTNVVQAIIKRAEECAK